MAIWVRNATPDGAVPEFRVITPKDGVENKWIRSRPAVGVKVDGVWYFDVHAASIRSGDRPNPHSAPLAAGTYSYYATTNGRPDGQPSSTQKSGWALDHMISNEEVAGLTVSISSNNGGGNGASDHAPVKFAPAGSRNCTERLRSRRARSRASPTRAANAPPSCPWETATSPVKPADGRAMPTATPRDRPGTGGLRRAAEDRRGERRPDPRSGPNDAARSRTDGRHLPDRVAGLPQPAACGRPGPIPGGLLQPLSEVRTLLEGRLPLPRREQRLGAQLGRPPHHHHAPEVRLAGFRLLPRPPARGTRR